MGEAIIKIGNHVIATGLMAYVVLYVIIAVIFFAGFVAGRLS